VSDHEPQPVIYTNIDPGMLLMFRVHTQALAIAIFTRQLPLGFHIKDDDECDRRLILALFMLCWVGNRLVTIPSMTRQALR
jgi:hypothetical protein